MQLHSVKRKLLQFAHTEFHVSLGWVNVLNLVGMIGPDSSIEVSFENRKRDVLRERKRCDRQAHAG
jgi:hypothetical protein